MITNLIKKMFMSEDTTTGAIDPSIEPEETPTAPEETPAVEETPAPEAEVVVEEPVAEPAPEVEAGREAGNQETI